MSGAGLLLVGAGGHAVGVAEAAILTRWRIVGYVDPRPADWLSDFGAPRHYANDERALEEAAATEHSVALGLGGVTPHALVARWGVLERYLAAGFAAKPVCHPRAIVSPSAEIGDGVTILAGVVVQPGVRLAVGSIVNSGAIVEHHAEIGCGAHIGPGAVVLGGARVGANALVGANAVVLPGACVPEASLVKAASRHG